MEQRISVGEQIGNWNDLRGVLDFKSNEELAEVLISHFKTCQHAETRSSAKQMISTPVAAQFKVPKLAELTVSEMSADSYGNGSTTETAVSGIEEMESSSSSQDKP
ncbi:uncharacterized protein LOC144620938 [Crassostrea virginica]